MRRRGFLLFCLFVAIFAVGFFLWRQGDRQPKSGSPIVLAPAEIAPRDVSAGPPPSTPVPAAPGAASAEIRRVKEASNFDRRRPEKVAAEREAALARAREERRKGAERLQATMRGVRVDFDEVLGSPASVSSTQALLTGAEGEGGAVPAVRMREFAADVPHRVVKGFVAEHAAMFGHGPAVLDEARVIRDYETAHNGSRTTVWQQELDGIRVFESTLQANVTRRGELVNISSHLVPDARKAAQAGTPKHAALLAKPVVAAKDAIRAAAETLGEEVAPTAIVESGQPEGPAHKQQFRSAALLDVGAEFVWLPEDESAMRLCWEVVFMSKARGEMFRTLVDAETGVALVRQRLTEYISAASYRVFTSDSPTPMSPGLATPGTTQPAQAVRTLETLEVLDTTASPNGWIDDGVNETRGNNVDAHLDINADNVADTPRPQGSPSRVFDFALDLAQAPSTYGSAAVTDLFYWNNYIHDRYYQLGFTEAAGNFQNDTFGRGGSGNDAVQADAQDGSGTNNANFSTPPDGSAGRMQMYVFTGPTPDRDGDFDHEIVIHEYTHGLSNRLVGGGVGISALQPRGMGEGWSDFYGLCLLSEPGDDPNGVYAAGGYATYQLSGMTSNYYFGIRRYPYCTDLTKNPLTFRDIDPTQASPHTGVPLSPRYGASNADPAAVHGQGEVWCVTLWEARARLIARHGATAGNNLILQLVTDGMKLAPQNPTFLQARDAIIQADLVNNAGANRNELWAAFAKRGMGASATSPASSTTTGLVEAFDQPDDLNVTPVAVVLFKGEAGGPFTPPAQLYTLANGGAASRGWTATDNQPWLDLSATSGTLAAGATTTVTAALNSAANSLANGTYTATVTFTNTTSGVVFARTITLRIGQVDYFTELFDTSAHDLDNQSFLFTPNASPSGYAVERQAVSAFFTNPAGGTTLAISHDSYLLATLTGGQQVRLYGTSYGSFYVGANGYITFGTGDSIVTESLAAHFSRPRISALMEHLTPGGQITWKQTADRVAVTWLNVSQYLLTDASSFQIEMFFDGRIRITNLAIAATGGLIGLSRGQGVPVDFLESDFSGYSNYSLTLTLPATAGEAGGSVNGTLQVAPPPTSPLTVALSSSDVTEATVPATVLVPAGQGSVSFPVTLVDDTVLDGTQRVVINAAAPTHAGGAAGIDVTDSETATLTVSLPATAVEGGANPQGSVSVSAPPAVNVSVALVSANPAEVTVPASVTIPAGQTTATFTATIVNDNRLDGTVATAITAQVANWTSGTASIAVADNDTATLAISLPGALREGDGTRTGTVQLGGTIPTALTVSLSSDDTTELTVPATVTVPAGAASVNFTATIVNDALADGAQPVQITADAAGFAGATITVSVADNDADHFTIAPIAGTQIRNVPFAITVTAKDVNDAAITNYNSSVSLTGTVPVTPATVTAWVNGVWAGNVTATAFGIGVVLTANDGQGHTGASNPFDVTYGPVARFAWSAIAPQQFVDAPFAVTLRAVDSAGNSVPTFTGSASLSTQPSSAPVETGSGTAGTTAPFFGAYSESRLQTLYPASEMGGAATLTALALNVSTSSASTYEKFTVRLKHSPLTTVASASFDANGWTEVYRADVTPSASGWLTMPFSVPFSYDGTSSLLVDISFDNATSVSPAAVSATVISNRAIYGYASGTLGDPRTWSGTTANAAFSNAVPNLRFTVAPPSVLPVNPAATSAFAGGEWTGHVSIPFTATALSLRATSGALVADSGIFAVSATLPPSTSATVFAEDFESGVFSSAWTLTGTGNFRTQITTFSPRAGTRHMAMDEALDSGSYARNEATLTLNLAGRTGVVLKFWAAQFGDEAEGPPPSPFPGTGADFDGVAISADGGNNWYEVQGLRTLSSSYTQLSVDLDAALAARGLAYASNFKIRFNQYDNYSLGTDGIGIDDILITANGPPSTLVVTLPAQVVEGAGVVSGSVSVAAARGSDLVLTLSSKSPAKITVPATVTIPAGQTSASFPFTVLDDPFVDGTKSVVITASGPGFLETGATVQVVDNDGGALTLALPATVAENAGSTTGTLTLSRPAVVPLTFSVTSSIPSAAQPPASVTVPRGAASATFTVTIPDDGTIDGDQLARITASLAGWVSGTADVLVQDNENRQLTVTIPASFRETDAPKTGTVSLNGTLAAALVVSLASSDITAVAVPASVTIPAGQTSANIAITVQDDLLADGAQPFTITASAATFLDGTASGQVRDNEAHHFTFAPIGSPQLANGPVPAIVTARDPLGAVLTDYSSTITLSAAGSGGPLVVTSASSGAFLNGVWSGSVQINALATSVVLTASDGKGHTGVSSAFDLVAGQIERFVWDAIPSPQTLDTPFTATVRAVDAGGGTVAAYHGIANLFVLAPSENPAIGSNNTTLYPTLYTYPHDARSDSLYLASELGGAARITALAFNVTGIRTGGEVLTNLTIRLKHTALANLGSISSWDNAGWTQVYRATPTVSATGWVTFNFATPFDYDGTRNLLVDLSFDRAASNFSYIYLQGTSISPPMTIFGGSDSANGDPLTWSTAPFPNYYYQRADVRFTTVKELPIRPAQSGSFASGVWTGQVSVPLAGSGFSLRARAGAVSGAGNAFNVVEPPAPPNGGATVLAEDFESGTLNPAWWTITGTGNFRTINSTANTPRAGTRHMTMDVGTYTGAYARNEATLTLNLAARSGVALSFWAKEFSDVAHGPPSSPFPSTGADFDGVAISADGGANWYEVQALRTLTGTYAQFTVNLDAALVARGLNFGPNFKIRFNQYGNDYIPYNGIAIDDILVTANPLAGFAINVPSQVTEGAGAVSASVPLDVAAGTDTVVALTSSAPAEITVPASVTIPAGQTSVNFTLTVQDDTIVDGSRTVAITGTVAGQSPRAALVVVLDDETLPLSLTAPAAVAETATGQTGTITIGGAASGVVTVSLASSDTTELTVPASVVLQPGQTKATFPITVVDDTAIDGTQIATITAGVPGWAGASAVVQVTDNETRNLSLSGPFSAYEGTTTSGTVSISGTLPTNLVVTLTSSNPAQFTVPTSATILAGQTSASFTGTAVDDTATDGTQAVTISASAATFTTATTTTYAYDNDVHHFNFSTITAPQKSGVPFATTITAVDVNNSVITPFAGIVTLTAAGDGGSVSVSPSLTGNFSSGYWSGNVTCSAARTNVRLTATSGSVTGVSNAFEVQLSPAIALSPASFTLTLSQGQTAPRTLTISNTGGGSLSWSIGTGATLAEVVSQGPEFVGTAQAGGHKDDAGFAPEPSDPASTYAELRAPAAVENALANLTLQSALNNLNSNSGLVRGAIPGRYAFSEGVTGNYIIDGGNDMYDAGNYLGTNLTGLLNYSDNVLASSTLLGTGGQYFTRKYDGLWVFAADVSGLSYFEITGNLGADGSGSTDSAVLSVVREGVTYRGFVKRVYNAGDPSVNHLIIVADNGSVTHEVSTDTNNDYHRLTNLTGVTRIYHVLYAGTAGAYIDNTATLNIMSVFLDAIGAPDWISPSPNSGTVAAGASQNVTLTVSAANLAPGTYNRTLVVTSNAPATPSASVPVTLNVVGAANLAVSPATGLTASGLRGGPFAPASQAFTVTNAGSQPLVWSASETAAWLDLSATGGTLSPGATTNVTASLNTAANSLASGAYSSAVTFTNTTNGIGNTTRPVALTVTAFGQLSVTPPTGIAVTGPFGGPFTPASRAYTLVNSGDAALTWTASKTAPWLSLSQASGTLAAGASTTVTATINAATTNPGNYTDSVIFTNTTNGRGNTTRAVSLAVVLPAPVLAPEPPATGGASNEVTWNAVFGAHGYEVQAATDEDFTTPLSSGWIPVTSHAFAGLSDGAQYRYRVRSRRSLAAASFAESAWSPTVLSLQDAKAPAITVTTPQVTASVVLSLAGLAADLSGIASLTVDGTATTTTDGFLHWSTADRTLLPGWNTFLLTAADTAVPANTVARAHTIYLATPGGDADEDGLPDSWEAAYGLDLFMATGVSGANGDPDKDGLVNLIERACGLNPRLADAGSAQSATAELNPADLQQYLVVRYRRLLAPGGLTYVVEVSGDLTIWSSAAANFEEIEPAIPTGDGITETVAVRIKPSIGTPGHPGCYVRIRVATP